MTPPSSNPPPFWAEPFAVLILGLLVRMAFVHYHPVIYGGDSVARIMNADHVFLAYQLPLLQLLIHGVNWISTDPIFIRCLMSLIGALAGAAFYFLTITLFDRPTAAFASLFFVFNPFLIVHSIVPYQEILMLLTLCLGLHFLLTPESRADISNAVAPENSVPPWTRGDFRGVPDTPKIPSHQSLNREGERHFPHNTAWASFFLGLACLTRYEAWVITAVAGLYYAYPRLTAHSLVSSLRVLGKTILLFGWAPMLWVGLHRSLSPAGTFVLEGSVNWARLGRIPYVLVMTVYHSGPVVGLLAIFGLVTFCRASLWRRREIQMVLVAAVLLLFALLFSAHGVAPDPQRYVTDRETHWFLLSLFWAAALALSQIRKHNGLRIAACSLASVLTIVWGTVETHRYLNGLVDDQNLKLDYAVAQHLERHLADDATALVFAKPLPPEATKDYFDKVYSQGGSPALEAARRNLLATNTGPPDYSRIVVNTRLGKRRILDANKLAANSADGQRLLAQHQVQLAAIFSDYSAQDPGARDLLNFVKERGKLQVTFPGSPLNVSIYEVLF